MSDFVILLIESFRQYQVWFLGALIILQCNGIPVGANFLVMASGAFVFNGELSLGNTAIQVWSFLLLGDGISYLIWSKAGNGILRAFPRLEKRLQPGLLRAKDYFGRYGRLTVLFTRFPLSALGPVVNISAGTSGFRFYYFIGAAALGELLWMGFNLGVGYWFGDSWDQAGVLVGEFGQIVLLLALLILMVYIILRVMRSRHNNHHPGPETPGPDVS